MKNIAIKNYKRIRNAEILKFLEKMKRKFEKFKELEKLEKRNIGLNAVQKRIRNEKRNIGKRIKRLKEELLKSKKYESEVDERAEEFIREIELMDERLTDEEIRLDDERIWEETDEEKSGDEWNESENDERALLEQ